MTSIDRSESTPSYGDDGRFGAYQASGLPSRGRIAWVARTESPVLASPTLAGDMLLVATAGSTEVGGALHAFDARTGAERWRHMYRDRTEEVSEDDDDDWLVDVDDDIPGVIAAPAVWGPWVFVEEWRTSRWIHVHDLHSGEIVHTIKRGGTPTVVGDLLLIHEAEAGARAVRLPELTEVWCGARFESGVESCNWLRACPAVGPDGMAYAALGAGWGIEQSGIVGFNPATGRVLFEQNGWEETWFAFAHPVVADGLVWTTEGDAVVGMDPRTGERRRVHRPMAGMTGERGPAIADGMVFVLDRPRPGPFTDDKHLQAIDSVNGDLMWSVPLTPERPFESLQVVGSPVVAGGTVYCADASGVVRAFGTGSGEARWSVETGHPIDSVFHHVLLGEQGEKWFSEEAQAILPGEGMLYVRTGAGVVALRDDGERPS
ncbi:PQQ-binding-like beta-propeller repeat protein [Streptomyces sp. NPDC053499]|uniref:outer membrane protein assembly factor BamB family protein n=1 Tax=Streptomyces sp. NPDC053499 TaxID=3365707 RepID=UPI0037D82EE7